MKKITKSINYVKNYGKYEKKNLTQKDVASQTGLSQQMVSKIESFNGNPSMLSFLKYCNCIGVDITVGISC